MKMFATKPIAWMALFSLLALAVIACSAGGGPGQGDGGGGTDDGSAPDADGGPGPDGGSGGSGSPDGGKETMDAGPGQDGGENAADGGANEPVYPLAPGMGPETADDCPTLESRDGSATTQVIESGQECFYDVVEETTLPAATAEYIVESVDDTAYVHLRVTFDPAFVDNTYGVNSVGWANRKDGIHKFKDLVGSDHVELILTNGSGDTAMHFKVDYISEDASLPSGYGTLGVTGGDGEMIIGDAADVLEVATSFDRNLNGCGYSSYTTDSPATDASYTPNADTPDWDYRMVYEVWIDAEAFGDAGFGGVAVEYVHASPSKSSDNTIIVEEGECPPDWDVPYCVPNLLEEGENCGETPDDEVCPDGYVFYVISEGEYCLPPPEDGKCPEGYVPDIASEGEICLPVE